MILETKKSNQLVFGGKVIETGIDIEDLQFVKTALSGKIYSSKYSFITEQLQNACDVSKEVGTDKKVKVGFDTDNNGRYIFFQDWATGISPDLMENVVAKFGKSTKRNSDDSDGAYGIGFYSLLAFSNQSYIITIVNGIKYTYILTDNNGAEFILYNTESTEESNGTTIKVYISGGYWELKEIKEQLKKLAAYFEDVDCSEFTYPLIKNDLFYFSQDFEGDDNIHICYGKGYYYKIPWKLLKIDPIAIKVAIPFKTGELRPSLSREELQLEKHHLELIETKLLNLMSYFKANIKTEFDNYFDYSDAQNGYVEFIDGLRIYYKDLGIENLVYKPLEELKLKTILPELYWGNISKTKCELTRNNKHYIGRYTKRLLIKDKDYLSQKYFRNYVDNDTVIEIPKLNLYKWKTFLNLKAFPKKDWRRLINLYIDWFKTEFNVITFSEIKESVEFKNYVEQERTKIQRTNGIRRDSITWIARWSETGNKRVVWDSNKSESKSQKIYVTKNTPKDKIEFLMSLIDKSDIQMIKAKEEDYEWVEENNVVAKVYYSLIIKQFLSDNDHCIYIGKKCLDVNFSNLIDQLNKFKEKNMVNISSEINGFESSLLKLIELHNLTDPISLVLSEVKNTLEKYPYFKWMEEEYYKSDKTIAFHNYIQSLIK